MQIVVFDFKRKIAFVTGTPEGDRLYADVVARCVRPRRTPGYNVRLKFTPR